jgi:DNA-binding transcriptional ArsR family regulator
MARSLHHPSREQLTLSSILEALSDPVRLQIVLRLADRGEDRCSAFLELASKANLSYHFGRMREAGVIRVRLEGASRYMSLRQDDLEARFPGLLVAVLAGARRESRARRRRPGERRSAAAARSI